MAKFNIFISWSGSPSKEIAEHVKELLGAVFAINRNIEFFLSSSEERGIDKGDRFQKKIDENLFKSDFGILIMTKNNITRPWIMFEAGSLAKNVDISKVSPILFDIDEIEKESPLFAFQYAKFTENEFNSLFQSILKSCNGTDELKTEEKDSLTDSLKKKWKDFEGKINALLNDPKYKVNELSHSLHKELSSDKLVYLTREEHLKVLIKDIDKYNGSRIIIFGGISTVIREAANKFVKWIVADENSQLFICYENEGLVKNREEDLDDNVYEGSNVGKNEELMKRKLTDFDIFKNHFLKMLGESPLERVHFIELTERLSGYVTIHGDELFFTPLLHKRSSLTFTFKLEKKQMLDVIDYMIPKITEESLKRELKMLKSEPKEASG